MAEQTPRATDWQLMRRIWPYARRSSGWLVVCTVAIPVGVLGALAQPLLLKQGIDVYIANGDTAGLAMLSGVFLGVVAVAFGMRSLGLYGLQLMGLRALAVLRRDLFERVMSQGQSFFDRRTTGSLMTRTTNDVEAIYESLAWGAVGLITDALLIAGTLVAMLWLDWRLTLVSFALSPVIVLVVDIFRRRLRVLFTSIRKSLSSLNGFFAEQINGMTVVQLSGGEARARRQFREMAHDYLDTYRRANWWDAALYAIMDGMSAFALGLLLWYGASRFGMADGSGITLGLLVAFIDYLNKVFVPIREFSGRFATLQSAVAALERVFGLFDTDERVARGDKRLTDVRGDIVFEDVSFRYGAGRPLVLEGVDFRVRPGEVVALVGATGSGKTTIGKLLQRMYDGYGGSIRIDGEELRDAALEDVRENVTVVHQDTFLFDGTIEENIGLWQAPSDRVRAAATRARATAFIDGWAAGFDHRITERGGNLSAGQRQLLCIARAMAREAPIVVLDEATASVDSLTEKLIDEAVAELFAEKTVVVIAHRLSTITKADRILVLHHGRLDEEGTHEELLAKGGRYRLLVETGFAL